MTKNTLSLEEAIRTFYEKNPYVRHLEMGIDSIEGGQTRLTMLIDANTHVNFYGFAHGGALASIADTAMGSACLSIGKKVVTIEMNFNCIKPALAGQRVIATANIIHNGNKTVVAEAEIRDEEGALIVKARGTFFVIGTFED